MHEAWVHQTAWPSIDISHALWYWTLGPSLTLWVTVMKCSVEPPFAHPTPFSVTIFVAQTEFPMATNHLSLL